jgi:hypothetical protein
VGGTELPNVLAIRAVDLLRVGLRESTAPPPVVARIERPTIPDRASPPPLPAPKPWEIRAEGIALFDSPALGGAFGGALGLARYVAPALRVGILVSGPIVGASWETSEGSAFLRQHIGFAEARLSVWRSQAVDLGASVCAGAHYLTAQGAARPPLLSQKDQVWSAAGALGADGSFRLTSNAGLALTVRAIGLTPRAGVGVGANTTVLQLPLLSASAGFLVGF